MNKYPWLCAACALLIAGQASAGWIPVDDPDLTDDAINPAPANSAPAGPASQSAANVKIWLDDLLNADAGSLLAQGNDTPDILPGLDALGAVYIVLHYGNGNTVTGSTARGRPQNINIAYACESDCDSFNPINEGLSGYRIFGERTEVPEPGTLGLLGAGLVGLALTKRRRTAA